MRQVARDALELVRLAEQGGFEIAWAAEHHTIELIVGPNPFTILTHWAAHTSRIRLGTAVVVAPYWHPIRVAGEAALFDIFSDGRLELGLGRGAFQYEFDRMAGGIVQQQGGRYMREMLPVVKALWQGDVEHHGELWPFPGDLGAEAVAAAASADLGGDARPGHSFAWAMESGANIMATPLSRPHAEVGILGQCFADTLAQFPGIQRPRFLMLRRTCVYARRGGLAGPGRGIGRLRKAVRHAVPEQRPGAERVSRTGRPGADGGPRPVSARTRCATAWCSARRRRSLPG